jgi:D-alanine-D-alanine ligase
MNIKKIAIVAGGDSPEWVISVQSAAMVANEIESLQYLGYVVQIKDGKWNVIINGEPKADIDKNDFSFSLNGEKISFDCALIVIHGTPGEDGKLQSYFELIGLPYTTCGVLASALTFNKNACKLFLKEFGIHSAKAILIKKNQDYNIGQIEKNLGMPCFVKPNESGSSFGVTKVSDEIHLESAIKSALKEGEEVIIEQFIKGVEVTCGMVKTSSKTLIFPITEVVSKNDFFDYEAKYTPGMSEEITPARISEALAERVRNISSIIYDALNCKGIVRIDYIISGKDIYFLEVNTVPGMSPNSIVPKQIRAAGLSVAEVYKIIIEEACHK